MASHFEVSGDRYGQFVVFEDGDGGRHAVRVTALVAASDLDQCRDATMLQLPGGRAVLVRMPLEGVLEWFVETAASPRGGRQILADALATWAVMTVLSRLMRTLLDEGVLSRSNLEEARSDCLVMAADSGSRRPTTERSFALDAAECVRDLFRLALPEYR